MPANPSRVCFFVLGSFTQRRKEAKPLRFFAPLFSLRPLREIILIPLSFYYVYKKENRLSFQEIVRQFIEGMNHTGWLEYIAVFTGIASVWFSRVENILVYPVGLINTILYIYLSYKNHLIGEA